MKNNIRFDLSDYLIHFFRDVDLETGSHIYLPEHCGFNNQHHACFIDAKYLLRLSLRSHKNFLFLVIPKWATNRIWRLPGGMLYRYADCSLFRNWCSPIRTK